MIRYHPPLELLLDYVAGGLSEGASLVVASHVELCQPCRAQVSELEAIGGALLEDAAAVDLEAGALDSVLNRLDEIGPAHERPSVHLDAETAALPSPVRRYLSGNLKDLAWHRAGRMLEEVRLPLAAAGVKASLMRMKAGGLVPKHTHHGHEYTLVLAGGYTDDGKEFVRGDFDFKDASDEHRLVVDEDEGCLCLVVLDAPVKLTGPMDRLLNPFLRI